MAPVYGWKTQQTGKDDNKTVYISSQGDRISEEINQRLKRNFLLTLCSRPREGVTEVRRDNKDNAAVSKVIKKEFLSKQDVMDPQEFISHMHAYASSAWVIHSGSRLQYF